jgi:PAS domain S-box-containing protein
MITAREKGRAVDERWHVRKDGSRFYASGIMTPIQGGQLTGYVKIARDMTEQRRASEALRITEERYRTALESAEMGAWDWKITEDRVIWNKEHFTMLGADLDHQPMDSAYFLHFIHPEDKVKITETLMEAVNTLSVYQAEFRIVRDDNEEVRWMQGFGRVVEVNEGAAVRMVGVMSDITERKRLEQQREEFIGIASHELKTPVTSIKAYAQILLEMSENIADAQSAPLLKKLDIQLDRLTKLIQDLLDTTKIAEGQLSLHKEEFDVEVLVADSMDAWQRLSTRHQLIWQPKSHCPLYADKERIRQVLTNFVSNAIKYSPNGGDIIITCHKKDDGVEFSVQDYGIGISEDMQHRVFDQFFRVKDARLQTFPGLGLGLYISAGIIQRHNGTIRVESKVGEGSTFLFTIPTSQEKEKPV